VLGPVGDAGVEDAGSVSDVYPGGSFGAGPAPGGGANVPSGSVIPKLPSRTSCQISRRLPIGPDPD
jgi:hypothetical protein